MLLKNKKILVTGAFGFLGKHLCNGLQEAGASITAIDNAPIPSELKNKENIETRNCDILDLDKLKEFSKDADIVFHLAAIANPRKCKENFPLAFQTNIVGTKNILESSLSSKMVVFISSAAVYGEPIKTPISETHPLLGEDPYAVTKIIGEHLCRLYNKYYGLPVIIIRNFNSFGVGQSTDYLIPKLIHQAITQKKIELWNLNSVRDFMYVKDTIDAFIKIVESGKNFEPAINVGSGRGETVGHVAEIVAKLIGDVKIVDLKKPTVGARILVADNSKLKELGWKETIGLEEGIKKVVQWMKFGEL